MANGASSFQHKFRISGPAVKVTKPPTRTAVSCIPCRTRKLKCNRSQPCESCTSRGCEDVCSYSSKPITPGLKDKARTQERIDRLEALVLDLARRTPESLGSASSPESDAARECLTTAEGSLDHAGQNQGYVGATHFSAILNGIEEIRSDLAETKDDAATHVPAPRPATIFRCPHQDDLRSILMSLPTRTETDRLVPLYFNAKFAKLPSLHAPLWFRTYEKFWSDPYSVHVLWIAQLFAVLCLAKGLQTFLEPRRHTFAASQPEENRYLSACARCMHLGGYLQPGPYVIETMILYSQCKFYIERNPGGELWMLMSMICAMALRMGLHRDPSHFPELTVFDAEMRRRTWLCIRQFDLLSAWQLGLRTNIQSAWTDTQPPRNLRDEDFDEYMPSLPDSRPETDVTGILFDLSKNELYFVIERILFEQLKSRHMPDELVWQLDKDLRRAYDKIPATLKLTPNGTVPPGDAPEHIFMKVKTSLLFNKSLCAIHRANMNTHNRSQMSSLNICVKAATTCLANMVYVFEESVDGGRLARDRWMRTSVHSADFFYAASILCWLLSEKRKNPSLECPFVEENKMQVLNNLVKAQQICDDQADISADARQVSRALRFILDKSGMLAWFPPPSNLGPGTSNAIDNMYSLSNGSQQPDELLANGNYEQDAPLASKERETMSLQLDNLFGVGADNVDWTGIDKFMQDMPPSDMAFDTSAFNVGAFNVDELDPAVFENLNVGLPQS